MRAWAACRITTSTSSATTTIWAAINPINRITATGIFLYFCTMRPGIASITFASAIALALITDAGYIWFTGICNSRNYNYYEIINRELFHSILCLCDKRNKITLQKE
jgi:hypothetical protein